MKEFVEKLIERLEEAGKYHLELSEANKMDVRESHRHKSFAGVYGKAIQIVKDLASEHNNDNICLKCKYELERVDLEPCVNCMYLYSDEFEPKENVLPDSDKLSDTWKQQTMSRFERVE